MNALEAKFVVVGTGRCGTGYMSKCFQAIGVPCGHEQLFSVNGLESDDGLIADSSWLAVPMLDHYDGYVVHVVRHPFDCIASLVEIPGLVGTPHNAWGRWLVKEFGRPKGFEDLYMFAARFWRDWNMKCLRHADVTLKIEDVDVKDLARICARTSIRSVGQGPLTVPKNYNTCHPAPIPLEYMDGVIAMVYHVAQQLGYQV